MAYKNTDKQREYQREWSRHNKEKVAEYRKEQRATAHGRAVSLAKSCRNRCKDRGIQYELHYTWVEEQILEGCSITGHKFDLTELSPQHMLCPSLDRIDPTKGYTKENTQIICWCINALKGTGTFEEMFKLAEMIASSKP